MHVRAFNRRVFAGFLVLAGLVAGGCHVAVGELTGQAADEWVRSYSLAPGGEIQIANTNGAIELEGHDKTTVDIRAERLVRAVTDNAARELVPRIVIQEDVTPEKVAIRTEGISGLLVGVSFQVRYHVRAPHAAIARLRTTNGSVSVKAFTGRVIANSTNGGILGEDLGGPVEARATNGNVRVGLAKIAAEGVNLRTTNGGVDLTLLESAKADLIATCRNGAIEMTGLKFEPDGDQTRRRVQGKVNGGGPPIEVATVNGRIRIRTNTPAP
jgi:hypothetical protein